MISQTPPAIWHTLTIPPDRLVTARQELHCAAQVVSSVGATLLPRHQDFSHASFSWASPNCLLGNEVKPGKAFRAVLEMDSFSLNLEGHSQKGYEVIAHFSLAGHKLNAAYAWMETELEKYAGKLEHSLLRLNDLPWVLPQSPMHLGAIFMAPNQVFKEWSYWFDNAYGLLKEVAGQHKMNATPVAGWPDGFDFKFRFEQAYRSLEVGFSPGDETHLEPYFKVIPMPAPGANEKLPELQFGRWHNTGWNGAILLASDILQYPDAASQQAVVRRFLAEAIADLHWFERG